MTDTLRSLTSAEIEEIMAKYPKARRIAVCNFLSSLGGSILLHAEGNLYNDSKVFGWKKDTISAIRAGFQVAKKPATVSNQHENEIPEVTLE